MATKRLISFSEIGFRKLRAAAKKQEISFSELIRRITDAWLVRSDR